MTEVGIVGCGIVGDALKDWIEKNHTEIKLRCFDPGLTLFDEAAFECEYIFVCVPAVDKSWAFDLSIIEDCLKRAHKDSIVYLRTTVTPGTSDMLSEKHGVKVIHVPEFLTERNARACMDSMPIITGAEGCIKSINFLTSLFKNKSVTHYSNATAEVAKVFHNVHGAYNVTLFNNLYSVCSKLDVKYNEALQAFFTMDHTSWDYSTVPGPDGNYGYDGKCFPKDVHAWTGLLSKLKEPMYGMFSTMVAVNKFYRNHFGKK